MKITNSDLKKIIKEELKYVINETTESISLPSSIGDFLEILKTNKNFSKSLQQYASQQSTKIFIFFRDQQKLKDEGKPNWFDTEEGAPFFKIWIKSHVSDVF